MRNITSRFKVVIGLVSSHAYSQLLWLLALAAWLVILGTSEEEGTRGLIIFVYTVC